MARVSVYTIGEQPCKDFLRGDADIAALGDGNRRNCHQCPKCWGRRAWCDNCSTDHHEHGWETCKPEGYRAAEEDDNAPAWGRPEWVDEDPAKEARDNQHVHAVIAPVLEAFRSSLVLGVR